MSSQDEDQEFRRLALLHVTRPEQRAACCAVDYVVTAWNKAQCGIDVTTRRNPAWRESEKALKAVCGRVTDANVCDVLHSATSTRPAAHSATDIVLTTRQP